MDRSLLLHLLLLDLCAFSVTQVPEEKKPEALRSFNNACSIIESFSVPHLKTYRDFINRVSLN